MELHAIWNRIDQLEQLIISQAKEIDLLRRIVSSTQKVLQINGLVRDSSCANVIVSNKQVNSQIFGSAPNEFHQHHSLSPIPHSYHHDMEQNGLRQKLISSPNRMSTPPVALKNYSMNPMVHPANAIPPVANRTFLYNATNDNIKPGTTSRNLKVIKFQPSSSQHNINHTSLDRTQPPSTRWSVGPNFMPSTADTKSLPELIYDNQDNIDQKTRTRQSRFSLIELITCFCPCFSMC